MYLLRIFFSILKFSFFNLGKAYYVLFSTFAHLNITVHDKVDQFS